MSSSSSQISQDLSSIQEIQDPKMTPYSDYSDLTAEVLTATGSRHQMRFAAGSDSGVSEDHLSINEEPEEEPYGAKPLSQLRKTIRKIIRHLRQVMLIICWLTFTYFLMFYQDYEEEATLLAVPPGQVTTYGIAKNLEGVSLVMKLTGPFTQTTFKFEDLKTDNFEKGDKPSLAFVVQEVEKGKGHQLRNISRVKHLLIADPAQKTERPPLVVVEKKVSNITFNMATHEYRLLFFTNIEQILPVEMFFVASEVSQLSAIIWALILLGVIYVNIMFDLVHRTFAGIISCSLGIGILAAAHLRPTLNEVFQYIEFDIIMSFFGISIIVEILAETGLQDYLAALSYELANGHIWPLLNFVFLSSCTLSTIFDDITLVLFLAPICLRLCEIMHLHCTPVLSCLIIAINVGSTLTPASSVTNNMIANHAFIPEDQMSFGTFTLHMLPATLLTLAQSYIHLRLQFINSAKIGTKEPLQLERLKRLTRVWRKVSDRMGGYSLDERFAKATVDTRIRSLRKRLKRLGKMPEPPKDFEEKVRKLRKSFPLQKVPPMVACLVSLFAVLLFSLLDLFTNLVSISIGWIAILGALLALSLCNYEDIEGVLSRIDWATMLFFSSLFILMKVLIKLGLIESIGLSMEQLIVNVEEKHRLTVAILATVWISAGLTTFMDNAPVVNMMIRIIATLSRNEDLNLPLMPLVWSLALGCCLGGNGSIMGAVVNIACAGVASKHGYMITFFGYLKIGFFVMIGNVMVASCYLLLAHVVGHWH